MNMWFFGTWNRLEGASTICGPNVPRTATKSTLNCGYR